MNFLLLSLTAVVFLSYMSFSLKFLYCVISFIFHLFFIYYLFDIFTYKILGFKISWQVVLDLQGYFSLFKFKFIFYIISVIIKL